MSQCLLVAPVGGSILVMFIRAVQYSTSSFLGTYIRPDQLTLANLTTPSPPEAFESAIANTELLGPGIRGGPGPGEVVAAAALSMPCRLQMQHDMLKSQEHGVSMQSGKTMQLYSNIAG